MAVERKRGRKGLIGERKLRSAEITVLDEVIMTMKQGMDRSDTMGRILRRIEIMRTMAQEDLDQVRSLLGDDAEDDDAGEATGEEDVTDVAEQVTG